MPLCARMPQPGRRHAILFGRIHLHPFARVAPAAVDVARLLEHAVDEGILEYPVQRITRLRGFERNTEKITVDPTPPRIVDGSGIALEAEEDRIAADTGELHRVHVDIHAAPMQQVTRAMRRTRGSREVHDLFQRAVRLPLVLDELAAPSGGFTGTGNGHAREHALIGTNAGIVVMDALHLRCGGRMRQAGEDDGGVQPAGQLKLDASMLARQRTDTAQQRCTCQLHGFLQIFDGRFTGLPHHIPRVVPADRPAITDRHCLARLERGDLLEACLQAVTEREQQRIGQERPVDVEVPQSQQQAVFHARKDHRQLIDRGHVARNLRRRIAQHEPAGGIGLVAHGNVAPPVLLHQAPALRTAGAVCRGSIGKCLCGNGIGGEHLVEQLAEYHQWTGCTRSSRGCRSGHRWRRRCPSSRWRFRGGPLRSVPWPATPARERIRNVRSRTERCIGTCLRPVTAPGWASSGAG